MANSYTTQFFRVSNGDITTHNPKELVGASVEINILSAEIKWEGVDSQTEEENTENITRLSSISDPQNFPVSVSRTVPSNAKIVYLQGSMGIFGGDASAEVVFDADGDGIGEDVRSLNVSGAGSDFEVKQNVGTGEKTVTVQNFTDPDDDADFDSARAFIEWDETTTEIVTKSTQDPRVTRDVSGESFGITLNDGEESSWITLSGLSGDEEEFYHDIDGSGEARFRFRFDWEKAYPDAVSQLRVYDADADVIHKVALADPADTQLDYNHVRVSEGGTTYAVDVVDPSDPDALSWFKMQTHKGVVSPRAFDQVSV